MIRFTIDGRQVEAQSGDTILKVARANGMDIPTLCYHEALLPQGACRLCVVEMSGRPRLAASCAYPVEEGTEVMTGSPRVQKARRLVVELLALRCPEVPRIQELAREFGVDEARISRFTPDDEKCILCGLCTRMCKERMGVNAIDFLGRGLGRKVGPPFDRHSPICLACGACQFVCPLETWSVSEVTTHKPQPILSEYNAGLVQRGSIYIPFPQAVPKVAVIDRDTCLHFQRGVCKTCENFCEAKAINYDQQDELKNINVGAVILATGYEPYNACLSQEFGFGRYPNVINALQMERLLSASGPTAGHMARPSDHQEPKKIAWLQCIGSRDQNHSYCSAVCCMYATKEAMLAQEHLPGVECAIFQMDMRAFGKGFDAYFKRGESRGIRYVRCRPSSLKEVPSSKNLIVRYQTEEGKIQEEEFGLVVLSVGLEPSPAGQDLARSLGIDLDSRGFYATQPFSPLDTSRPGIFVCGASTEPKDIPDTVVQGSGAAAQALRIIGQARGTQVTEKVYPPERPLDGAEPRIGVFVCHCGSNIAGVVDVKAVAKYVATLPNVVHAESIMYTCSADSLNAMPQKIAEFGLNRVIVASCTPRTHEPLFQETLRGAGLNPYLFEMANIRDQCSWVHSSNHEEATEKAKVLVRMAVARARFLEPLHEESLDLNHQALVVGGGVAGMTASLSLADQGYQVFLVEREKELGGCLRQLHSTVEGADPVAFLASLEERVRSHDQIEVITGMQVAKTGGFVGNYKTTLASVTDLTQRLIEHGVTILATGGQEYRGPEYLLGQDPRVITQADLEARLAQGASGLGQARDIVMVQCVGPWESQEFYCSRLCCSLAMKNALELKKLNPKARIHVLFKEMRTYGFKEELYTAAREAGVLMVRYADTRPPQLENRNGRLELRFWEPALREEMYLEPDLVVLSEAIVPSTGTRELASLLKVPLSQEGFLLEAHIKLRPVDFASEGLFLCGMAQYPKFIDESIAQASAAAARATTILARKQLLVGGVVAKVEAEKCAACLTCVRVCPYQVPSINQEGVAQIEAAMCQGCGTCASECPAKAIQLLHYRDEQMIAKTEAVLVGVG